MYSFCGDWFCATHKFPLGGPGLGMAPTRPERVELIEQDNGPADDTVWVTPAGASGTSEFYHQDRDCPRLKGGSKKVRREWSREKAQRRQRAPCRVCVLSHEPGGTGEVDCPFCGTTVGKLPSHLPCDGDD